MPAVCGRVTPGAGWRIGFRMADLPRLRRHALACALPDAF